MHADRVLFVELFYAMIDGVELERAESITVPLQEIYPGDAPGTYRIPISGAELEREGLLDVFRREIRLAVATADWPYHRAVRYRCLAAGQSSF